LCPFWAARFGLKLTSGFALTGSDDADIKVIGERADCVFASKNELFRLNNV